ncbi:MAG TPA: ATP-binding cassette domain-containing protein, partial [Acidimicrobiales bacterium]|nr:ATP-binding cassette domain-containing protein [Acidimicrobiales bacterium]
MADTLYQLRDVQRVYRTGSGTVAALAGIDLDVEAGEFVAVEGPSGSGKSTMLQMLGALDRPTSGSLQFDGRELQGLNDAELTRLRSRDIGFVFQ